MPGLELAPKSRPVTTSVDLPDDEYIALPQGHAGQSVEPRPVPDRGRAGPWAGIARLGMPSGSGRDAAVEALERAADWLPGFASALHRDARTPVNLTPVGGLERHLHRRQGDEIQTYVLALAAGASPREGAPFDVVVSAVPDHAGGSKTLTLQIDGSGYTLSTDDGISGTLSRAPRSFTATITPPTNDRNRADDAVTLKAYSGTVDNAIEATQTVTVVDAHALPAAAAVTVEATDTGGGAVTSVAEGGGAVNLTVSIDRGRGATAVTGEALSVALALAPADPAQASTYRLAPTSVALPAVAPAGSQSAATTVRLEALVDKFVNDDRLTVNLVTTGEAANGPGSVDSTFTIAVRDTTVKKVSAKSDAAVKQAFDAAQAGAAGGRGGGRAEPRRGVQRGGERPVRGDCLGQHRRLLGHVVRPGGAGVGVEHRGGGDRGLGRQRHRPRQRAGDGLCRLVRRAPDPLGRSVGRARRHRRRRAAARRAHRRPGRCGGGGRPDHPDRRREPGGARERGRDRAADSGRPPSSIRRRRSPSRWARPPRRRC